MTDMSVGTAGRLQNRGSIPDSNKTFLSSSKHAKQLLCPPRL